MSTVVNLKEPVRAADPIFEISDLEVGAKLEFHSQTGVVIERTIKGVIKDYRLRRKGWAEREADVLKFDDGYRVGAGYAWRSVQWRLRGG